MAETKTPVVDLGSKPDPASLSEVARAAALLAEGEVIAYATETVFGLACDAANPDACRAVCRLKGREQGPTLPVQVFDPAPPYWPVPLPEPARKLFATFAPGPISVVVPGDASLAPQTLGEGGTVALRVPGHPVALAVLGRFARPVACTSANPTGGPPATSAAEVLAYFPEGLTMVLTGGPAPAGTPSTLVDATVDPARVLRIGVIDETEVRRCLQSGS